MKIYLDNAATTPLNREVYQCIEPYQFECYGNPSSAHALGREARTAIEKSRRTIASLLNTEPSQITFTSGGTEGDNLAIRSAVEHHQVKTIITSPLEHHAVLNVVKALEDEGKVSVLYLMNDEHGRISLRHLENLLAFNEHVLVSIMHGNNELGNLNDIEAIAALCKTHDAYFHSDTVQTIGHHKIDLKELGVDFIVASAHKFNGPKGVGFIYNSKRTQISSVIKGGGQEYGRRAGTEHVAGIVGLAKALELAYRDSDINHKKFRDLKEILVQGLKHAIPGVLFNGLSAEDNGSLPNILSVSLPDTGNLESVIYFLDSNNIFVSGGSACNSHSAGGSHVLKALAYDFRRPVIRFSFGPQNTVDEIRYTIARLSDYCKSLHVAHFQEAS